MSSSCGDSPQSPPALPPGDDSSRKIYSPARRSLKDFFEFDDDDNDDEEEGEEEDEEEDDYEEEKEEDSLQAPRNKKAKLKVDEDDDDNEKEGKEEDDEEELLGSDEEEVKVCIECGATPCEWVHFEHELVEFARNNQFFVNHTNQDDPFSFPVNTFSTMSEEEKDEIKAIRTTTKITIYSLLTLDIH